MTGPRTTQGLFIAGTDTGVGKTRVTAGLLHALRRGGLRALGMKPVASGSELRDGCWRNADADALIAAMARDAPDYGIVNPYAFPDPIAPELAARRAGVVVSLDRIRSCYAALAAEANFVLVEGVGGWAVPLGADLMQAELVRWLGLPVLLVVGMRLGCQNHAFLSARAIADDGCRLAGWIANRVDPDMAAFEENVAVMTARLGMAPLVVLPHEPVASEEAEVARYAPVLQRLAMLTGTRQ